MKLNTENKKQAFERTMMLLGKQERLNCRKLCKLLTRGNDPYCRTEDASSFLQDLVSSDDFPVERNGEKIVRTDLKKVVS